MRQRSHGGIPSTRVQVTTAPTTALSAHDGAFRRAFLAVLLTALLVISAAGTFSAHMTEVIGLAGFAWVTALLALRPVQSSAVFLAFWPLVYHALKDVAFLQVGGFAVTGSRAAGFVLIPGLLLHFFSHFQRSRKLPATFVNYALLGTLAALSLGWSIDRFEGVIYVARYVSVGLLLLVGYRADESGRQLLKKATYVAALMTGASTFVGFVLGLESLMTSTFGVDRAAGLLGAPGATATLCWLGLSIAIADALSRKGAARIPYLAMGGFFGVSVIMTGTRAIMIGILVFLAISWMTLPIPKQAKRWLATSAVLVALVGVSFIAFLPDQVVSGRFVDIEFRGGTLAAEAGTGRVGLWRAHWSSFMGAPLVEKLVGKGVGASFRVSRGAYGNFAQHFEVQNAHNAYLQCITELGLVGLAVFLFWIVSFVTTSRRRLRAIAHDPINYPWLAALFVPFFAAYHVSAEMFGTNIFTSGSRLYFLLFVGMTAGALKQKLPAPRIGGDTADDSTKSPRIPV